MINKSLIDLLESVDDKQQFEEECIERFKKDPQAFSDFLYGIFFGRVRNYLVAEYEFSEREISESSDLYEYFSKEGIEMETRELQAHIDLHVPRPGLPLWKLILGLLILIMSISGIIYLTRYLSPDRGFFIYNPLQLDRHLWLIFMIPTVFVLWALFKTVKISELVNGRKIKTLGDLALKITETNKIFFEIQDYERTRKELKLLYTQMNIK